jgi:hypothetical protein
LILVAQSQVGILATPSGPSPFNHGQSAYREVPP